MGGIKTLSKNTIIYSLSNVASKLAGFILLPFYTDLLTLEEFGILGIFEVSFLLFVTPFSFSITRLLIDGILRKRIVSIGFQPFQQVFFSWFSLA